MAIEKWLRNLIPVYRKDLRPENGRFKPGLQEPQLQIQVQWRVTFLYSLVVERRC